MARTARRASNIASSSAKKGSCDGRGKEATTKKLGPSRLRGSVFGAKQKGIGTNMEREVKRKKKRGIITL